MAGGISVARVIARTAAIKRSDSLKGCSRAPGRSSDSASLSAILRRLVNGYDWWRCICSRNWRSLLTSASTCQRADCRQHDQCLSATPCSPSRFRGQHSPGRVASEPGRYGAEGILMGMWETTLPSVIGVSRRRQGPGDWDNQNNRVYAQVAEGAFTGVRAFGRRLPYLRYQDQRIEDDIPDGHVAYHRFPTVMISTAGGHFFDDGKEIGRKEHMPHGHVSDRTLPSFSVSPASVPSADEEKIRRREAARSSGSVCWFGRPFDRGFAKRLRKHQSRATITWRIGQSWLLARALRAQRPRQFRAKTP